MIFALLKSNGYVTAVTWTDFITATVLSIPITFTLLSFVQLFQRLVFLPGYDVKRIRSVLLPSAAIWTFMMFLLFWWSKK